MNREEASSGIQEGYESIKRIFDALFEPVNDLTEPDNQTATDIVYLIELAQSMVERVSDETWQATP